MVKQHFPEGSFRGSPEIINANKVEAIRVSIENILGSNPGPEGKLKALEAIDEAMGEIEETGNEASLDYFKSWAAELRAKLPDQAEV